MVKRSVSPCAVEKDTEDDANGIVGCDDDVNGSVLFCCCFTVVQRENMERASQKKIKIKDARGGDITSI